tara:strand:+ start:2067 stop:2462 length:396 start_codon:yes stop_codon:yes gene_type:complete
MNKRRALKKVLLNAQEEDPKNPKKKKGFRAAFSSAKNAGKKTFTWNGNSYTTTTAEEKAENMSRTELEKEYDKYLDVGGLKSKKPKSKSLKKSTEEIKKSYYNKIGEIDRKRYKGSELDFDFEKNRYRNKK